MPKWCQHPVQQIITCVVIYTVGSIKSWQVFNLATEKLIDKDDIKIMS